jgi:hypothetical protein
MYPDITFEMQFDGTNWTNVTADLVGSISGKYGILANGPTDRVGDVGKISFTLNNSQINSARLIGYYSPGHTNCRAGFDYGLAVRLTVTFEGNTKQMIGSVTDIRPIPGLYRERQTLVECSDWFYMAENHELDAPDFTTNKNIGEIVTLIVANMATPPAAVTYNTGSETFSTVFDTVTSRTTAITEFTKLALSELGYIYMTDGGRTLMVEGRETRNNNPAVESLEGGYLLKSDGGYLLWSDDSKILLSQDGSAAIFDNSAQQADISYGKQLYNRIKATSYPRRISAAPVVLYQLSSPMELKAGITKTFTGRYIDINGISKTITGKDMITPAATTDYLMNTLADGLGTNLTANLTVTADYGMSEVAYTITNTGGTDGFVTKLQARGTGIYIDAQSDYIAEDSTSILKNGIKTLTLDMKYQDDPTVPVGAANVWLYQYKDPRASINTIQMMANANRQNMVGFILLEPGDRIRLIEDVSGISADYIINGLEYEIFGKIIHFTWHVRAAFFDSYNFAIWDTSEWEDGTTWGF